MNQTIVVRLAVLAAGWGVARTLLDRWNGRAFDASALLLQIGAAAAIVGALSLAASRTRLAGMPRLAALVALAVWVPYASSLIEALVFGVIGREVLLPALVMSVVTGVVLAAGVHATLPAPDVRAPSQANRRRGAGTLLGRAALCILAFAIVYLLAGAMAYPFVKDYYAGRALPGLGVLLSVQLVRGLGLVLATFPLIAPSEDRGWARAGRWAVALVLLASVAPLLPKNDLMPGPIRLAHGIELAGAHLLLGALFAAFLGSRSSGSAARETAAAVEIGRP